MPCCRRPFTSTLTRRPRRLASPLPSSTIHTPLPLHHHRNPTQIISSTCRSTPRRHLCCPNRPPTWFVPTSRRHNYIPDARTPLQSMCIVVTPLARVIVLLSLPALQLLYNDPSDVSHHAFQTKIVTLHPLPHICSTLFPPPRHAPK